MALRFFTGDAKSLLDSFNARIEQHEAKGKITTWQRSDDKKYYTHTAPEWRRRAWFKPAIYNDRLTFNIIKPKDSDVSTLVYAYYHGHLTETFLNHFDKRFSSAVSTAMPTDDDLCSS